MNNIHEIIRDRYSSVIFSPKQIEDEKLALLFEAARWAYQLLMSNPGDLYLE